MLSLIQMRGKEDFTRTLSSEHYQRLSYVIPSLVGLKARLNECTPTTKIAIEWKKYFLNKVTYMLVVDIVYKAVSTWMDPRFKEAGLGTPKQAESARKQVISEIEKYNRSNGNDNYQDITSPDTPSTSSASGPQGAVPEDSVKQTETKDNDVLKYSDDKLQAKHSANPVTRLKVEQYLNLPHVSRGEDSWADA